MAQIAACSWYVSVPAANNNYRINIEKLSQFSVQKFRLGVPIRDMRLLDPNLLTSETGKILVRDNAIVFSVEHVRLIITADFVIIPQTGFERSSSSMRFAAMLEEAIIEAAQEKQARHSFLCQGFQTAWKQGCMSAYLTCMGIKNEMGFLVCFTCVLTRQRWHTRSQCQHATERMTTSSKTLRTSYRMTHLVIISPCTCGSGIMGTDRYQHEAFSSPHQDLRYCYQLMTLHQMGLCCPGAGLL